MTEINDSELNDLRYERKFRVEGMSLAEIENIVRLHPRGFVEAFPKRCVNNIYFDSLNMQTFSDNVDGIANRTKYRIRWYGELFGEIMRPVLEHKIKNNLAGRKKHFILKPFNLKPGVTVKDIHSLISASDMSAENKLQMLSLHPTLLNCYTRKYFASIDGQYRLTLDYDLSYYHINVVNNSFMSRYDDRSSVIVELKYPIELDDEAQNISNYFPFRMTKNSKYVSGIQMLYGK